MEIGDDSGEIPASTTLGVGAVAIGGAAALVIRKRRRKAVTSGGMPVDVADAVHVQMSRDSRPDPPPALHNEEFARRMSTALGRGERSYQRQNE